MRFPRCQRRNKQKLGARGVPSARLQHISRALSIYATKLLQVAATYGSRAVHNGLAARGQLRQCPAVLQGADHGLYAEWDQWGGAVRRSGQCADAQLVPTEVGTEVFSDETGSAGNGDQSAGFYQAEATLRRISSATALRCSISCASMKSSRAFERESLPDEVRGNEWTGTSLT